LGLGTVLYFSLKSLPVNFSVPVEVKKKVDIYSLQRDFSSFFPKEERKVVKQQSKPSKRFVRLPKPLKVLGYVEGLPSGVILKAGRKTLVLVQGEETKGWKLLRIDGNFAYLTYKGIEVKVPLKEEKKTPTAKVKYQTTTSFEGNSFTISRSEVERLTQNYGALLTQVDFVPYIVNGQTQGFKLRWLSPSSIFYKIGFRQGDVILSVNGIPIRNTEDVFKVLQILRNEPSLRVKVLRSGKEITFNIRIS